MALSSIPGTNKQEQTHKNEEVQQLSHQPHPLSARLNTISPQPQHHADLTVTVDLSRLRTLCLAKLPSIFRLT